MKSMRKRVGSLTTSSMERNLRKMRLKDRLELAASSAALVLGFTVSLLAETVSTKVMGWGWPISEIPTPTKMTPEEIAEAQRKADALKMIEDKGVGLCSFCNEDIVKNNDMPGGGWTWESE